MTPNFKSDEYVLYRNKKLRLISSGSNVSDSQIWPLSKLLSENKVFEDYEAEWLLKDSKLLLSGLKTESNEIKKMFTSNLPQLAEWYSGTIELEIGNCDLTQHLSSFKYIFLLHVENGLITKKNIVCSYPNQKYRFEFGKHKNKTIDQVVSEDSQYIEWALKNVGNFAVLPSQFERKFEIEVVKDITANQTEDSTKIIPVLEKQSFTFPKKLIKFNSDKFKRINGVRFNEELNSYELDISPLECSSKFSFYLNEYLYGNPNPDYKVKYFENNKGRTYYNSNNWLSDAAGDTDSEVMNDAFWNMD